MADEKGKARPVQERIAALFGKSSFFDPKEGAPGTSPAAIKHSDVAAALGFVSREKGRIAALVLETHYGSTLAHERELLKAWESSACHGRDHAEVVLTRFGGALAIRQFAGMARHNTTQYAEYAYLIFSRREALQDKVASALDWLQQEHNDALPEFKRVMREHAQERVRRRMDKAA